jgi:hypothetical protein
MQMGLWLWLLIAPLVFAVLSLFLDRGGTHYQHRDAGHRDDIPRADAR